VASLTATLDIESFSVLGWSAGGPYALACAQALGTRVRAAATVGGMAPLAPPLAAAQLGLSTDRLLFPLARRSPATAAAVVWSSRLIPKRTSQRLVMRSVSESDRAVIGAMTPTEFMADLRDALRHGPRGIVDDYLAVGGDWGFAPEDLAGPVTLFQGAEDALLPREHAEALAGRFTQGRLEIVAGAGHFLLHTHLDAVLDALR
jgi:pimeloyl-ACP methyl ester carboxylesterase